MALLNRETLKNFFRKGKFPSEVHFSDLIDSTVNKIDDGFAKSEQDGLQLAPQGESSRLISFFEKVSDALPRWQLNLKKEEKSEGLSFDKVETGRDGQPETVSRLFLHQNGNVGVHTTEPAFPLEVNGAAAMKGRVGTCYAGQVEGDGKWHDIITGLDGVHAFEIVARIDGPPSQGKYAISHAIAVSAFGKSRNRIRQTRSHFGWFWNRIEMRWKGSIRDNNLQIRTRSHYGIDPELGVCMIRYHVTSLWDEERMNALIPAIAVAGVDQNGASPEEQ